MAKVERRRNRMKSSWGPFMEVPRQCETPKWSPVEPFSALGRVPVRSFSGLFIRFRKENSRNFACTNFSEVRSSKNHSVGGCGGWQVLATVIALCNTAGLTSPALHERRAVLHDDAPAEAR